MVGDLHQLSIALASGFDRDEIVIADRSAGLRERADETDQRVAPSIAGRLAIADLLEFVALEPRELAELSSNRGEGVRYIAVRLFDFESRSRPSAQWRIQDWGQKDGTWGDTPCWA
jgi:hypothetical protein